MWSLRGWAARVEDVGVRMGDLVWSTEIMLVAAVFEWGGRVVALVGGGWRGGYGGEEMMERSGGCWPEFSPEMVAGFRRRH
ncbi:hypothetical protein Tco_0679677 [Tanacetum coccineum]|uniref:Uncharacterized protein n=1 Tax=Tanacetum coccineum TaxID=301880 RepID=A0ABQ4XII0_9ASTR